MHNHPNPEDDPWIAPGKAAAELGVTGKTLAKLADTGRLRARKLPSGHRRYLQSSVSALAAQGEGLDGDGE
jgi:predicted site-specific integrase-resolvase